MENKYQLLQEQIIYFNSKLVRTENNNLEILSTNLIEIMNNIIRNYTDKKILKSQYIELLTILYKIIGFTRDYINGKGEYMLAYMMIYTWYSFFPELSKYALSLFVIFPSNHPYGSWKDIKYFCNYCKNKSQNINHPLIIYAIELTNKQLQNDLNIISNISLVSKWIPREKSKFGWLFKELAKNFYSYYFINKNPEINAYNKAYTNYRHIISSLNIKLQTVQIDQCANQWENIQYSNLTSITLFKQKYALLNKTKDGLIKLNTSNRINYAESFKIFTQNNKFPIKGKYISLGQFTKEAFNIISVEKQKECNLNDVKMVINKQWTNFMEQINPLTNIIPIIDTSSSMQQEALYNSIGFGICVAEKSSFKKRILTFDNDPTWINLDNCNNFVEMVGKVFNNITQLNSNLYKTVNNIFEISMNDCEINKIYKKNENITFILFTDLQTENLNIYINYIQERFINLKYKIPNIYIWNLISSQNITIPSNIEIISGYNPLLLNILKKNIYNKPLSHYNININKSLIKILSNKRYLPLEKKIFDFLN